ncbi:MAG: ankyrin repeat domain-containing protein [Gammaproteobacteria bacterium]
MSTKLTQNELDLLREIFSDLINYDSEDPTEPIDPLTWHEADGDTCLHYAACRGSLRAVELLLKAGLNVDQPGDMGCTPLHYAKLYKHDEVAKLLLQYGASDKIRNEFGKLPSEM